MSLANLPQLLDRHRANKAAEEVEAVKSAAVNAVNQKSVLISRPESSINFRS